jgi:hypothetical protein
MADVAVSPTLSAHRIITAIRLIATAGQVTPATKRPESIAHRICRPFCCVMSKHTIGGIHDRAP